MPWEFRWVTATKGSELGLSAGQRLTLSRVEATPPGLNFCYPGVSGGPLFRLTCVSPGPVLDGACTSAVSHLLSTWPAQLVALGGEVAALSNEEVLSGLLAGLSS